MMCTTKHTDSITSYLLLAVLRFHFDRAYYSTHEDSGLIILTVIKEGYHKVSITVELYTHSQSSGNSAIGTCMIGIYRGIAMTTDALECNNTPFVPQRWC